MQLEITSGCPWDFSHAPSQIIDVVEKQDCNIYFFGFPLSCYAASGHQAPVYAGILMPRNAGPPTNMMCVGNNQNTSSEQFVSFDEFGYSWQQSADPDHNGQVYSLTCSKDFGSMSEEDSYRLEYGNLFMPYPDLLSTNCHGKLNVETVHFSCTRLDGELDTGTWYPKEMHFEEYIDGFVEHYYNDEDDLKEAGYETDEEQRAKLAQVKADLIPVSLSKSYPPHLLSIALHNFLQYHILVSQILQASLARTRNQQQEINDLFFRSVDYDASILGAIGFITLFPINYPSDTVPRLPGAYMDKLWKQAGDGGTCRLVIDTHYPIEKSTFPQILRQLDPNYSFNITDPSSSARLLHVLSIIDFVFATSGFGTSSNSNYDTSQFVDFLCNIVSNYGMNRIIKFIGEDSSGLMNIWNVEAKYSIYIKGLIREAEQSIAGVGRPPSSWLDHLLTSFDSPRSRRSQQRLHEVESIRFEEGSKMLQAKFVGEQTYRPISVKDLQSSASEAGTSRLILQAVCQPGRSQPLPAGSHVNLKDEEEEKPNCFKEALLMSGVPSPSGHQRIRKSLPDEREVSMPELYSILDENIKTVVVRQVKENIHCTAMTGQSDMVGVFYDEQRKHCVYINGGKDTISDPADGYPKDLSRSDDSLNELGISEFSELYIVSRLKGRELSDKSRKKLEKKLKLPFF